MQIRVIIVDDHQLLIDGLKEILESSPDIQIVGEALNGKVLLQLLEHTETDVVLMDFDMPELNGLETTKILKEKHPAIKALILTTHDETKIIREIFKAGAAGYILKNVGKQKLIEAITTVNSGNKFVSQEILEKLVPIGADELRTETRQTGGVPPEALTPREIEILRLIALEYSTQDISKELFISDNTVGTHRKNLLRKTDSKNVAGLVKYAIKYGVIKM